VAIVATTAATTTSATPTPSSGSKGLGGTGTNNDDSGFSSSWTEATKRVVIEFPCLVAALFVVMIVCGASPYENLGHTAFAAMYLATLSGGFLDPPVFASSSGTAGSSGKAWTGSNSCTLIRRLRGSCSESQSSSKREIVAAIATNATIATTIPFQILLLYDRGWQLQRWPVPVVLGSSIGWCLGTVLGTAWVMIRYGSEKSVAPRTRDD